MKPKAVRVQARRVPLTGGCFATGALWQARYGGGFWAGASRVICSPGQRGERPGVLCRLQMCRFQQFRSPQGRPRLVSFRVLCPERRGRFSADVAYQCGLPRWLADATCQFGPLAQEACATIPMRSGSRLVARRLVGGLEVVQPVGAACRCSTPVQRVGAVRRGAARRGAVRRGAVRRGAVRRKVGQRGLPARWSPSPSYS